MTTTKRRRGATVAGVLAIAVGVLVAVVVYVVAEARRDDAIAGLARAPAGCDTTLDFDESGTYLVFIETTGDVGDVRGDCGVDGEFAVDDVPEVAVSLVDPDGRPVELVDRDGDVTYDGAGSSGRSRYEVDITTAGDHVMRVEASGAEGEFAVAVGRDPGRGVGALRLLAGAAALLGIGLGIVLLARGRSVGPPEPAPAGPWERPSPWAGSAPVSGPPGPPSAMPPPPRPLGPPTMPPTGGGPTMPPTAARPPAGPPPPPPGAMPSPWGAPPAVTSPWAPAPEPAPNEGEDDEGDGGDPDRGFRPPT